MSIYKLQSDLDFYFFFSPGDLNCFIWAFAWYGMYLNLYVLLMQIVKSIHWSYWSHS